MVPNPFVKKINIAKLQWEKSKSPKGKFAQAYKIILTGTPEGVGFARKPPVWLKSSDTIAIDIEKIGTLTNPVV